MSSRRYTTEFVITGDSSSGVKASRDLQRANADLTQEMQRAERQGEQMGQSFASVTVHAQRLATASAATAAAVGTMAVSQTRNVAEQAAFAEAVGVSVQTLQRWEFAAKAAGMQSGAIGDIFKDTAEKIGDFVNTSGGEAADLFEVLGLSISELMDLSPDQQLLSVARAFDEVGNRGAKIAFIEGLGNDATRLLPLLEDNAAALKEQFRIADQLSVAMPQSDVDSLIAANQALNELTELSVGFGKSVAVDLAPSFVSLSSNAQQLVSDLGGMGEIVDAVSDGTVLLTGVLAGRLVGSLVEAGQATINKVKADRAAALQSAANARQETATALAVARRAEAEQVAAISSAQATVQRNQSAVAEAAAKLRVVQINQQLLASDRALETQRLQAQISATGRQMSLTRLAEIRRTEMGLMAQATAANNALQVAEQETAKSAQAVAAAKTAAGRAATATNAAYAANTAAANTAATANTVLAGAATAASRAMRLVGGPVGVATLAASAFFLFRDSSEEVNASLVNLDDPLESTIESFREMNSEAQQASVIRWGDRAEEEADKASAALGSIRQEIASLSGARIFGGRDEEQYEGYRRLLTEINAVGDGARNLTEVLDEAQQYMEIPDDVLRKLRLLAAEYAEHEESSQQAETTLAALVATLDDVANSADNAGDSVNNGAPSGETLEAWGKYNDRLRESIAAARDGGSAVGAANRAMDGMGEGVSDVMRGYTIFLTAQDEALKQQKKAQEEAARAAEQATTEAERNAQRQAQAAEQAAEQQATALVGIQQEMEPLLADHAEYVERLGVLDQALAEGSITQEQYGELLRWSAEQYKRAATGAEDYEKDLKALVGQYDSNRQKAEQLAADERAIQVAFETNAISAEQYVRMMGEVEEAQYQLALESEGTFAAMATAWDRSIERMDDAGVDFWRGFLDGTGDAVDQFKNIVMDGIAEVAHALITRPLTVGLTADLQGMLGLGAGGQKSGGGLNFSNTLSAGRNLWNAGSSLLGGGSAAGSLAMQGGLSSAALASAGQVAGGAAYSGALGSAASGAALGNAATGGFMSAASAAMPWVAGGMVIDEVLGLGIVDGIVSGISGLFGSSPTPFSGRFGTRDTAAPGTFEHQDSTSEQFYQQSALGAVGFLDSGTERLQRAGTGNKEWAEEVAAGAAQIDNLVASLAQGEPELNAMRAAVQGLETSSRSAADIVEFALNERPRAALEAMGGEFGTFVRGLSGSIEEVVQQAQTAQQAHEILASGMDRLNLQFDASTAGAYAAAGSIAEMVGGIDNLASLQSTYFDNFLTEGERAAYLQNDLADSLGALGLQLPQTRSGYRDLVEAQNLNTEAGQRTYAQLLQLAPAFADLVPEMGDMGTAARDFAAELSAARDVVATAEGDVRSAYQAFESQSFAQQIALLELMGDSETALALQRERELEGIDPLLHESQRRYWALEDEAAAQQKATQAAQSYVSELSRVRDELSNSLGSINSWMDQQNATGGTPGMNLAETRDQLARQLVLAESGDRSALQSITQYADRVLAANDEYNASGPAGQAIKDEVLAALEALPGQISAEEYLAQEFRDALQKAVDELPGGIASSLHPLFDSIDLDASGLIDWQEFYSVFQGMASDDELRRIFAKLDEDGSGTIRRLEALNRSSDGTEDNTQTLDERARDQLDSLNGLVSEMTRTTNQFVGLNSTMVSLKDSINALGVAREEVARIEEERLAAEKAERDRIAREREQAARAAQINSNIEGFVSAANVAESRAETLSGRLDPRDVGNIERLIDRRMDDGEFTNSEWEQMLAHLASTFGRDSLEYLFGREYSAMYRNQTRANDERAKLDGSHSAGLEYVPFDGYVAELHKGEKVLTREDAEVMRNLPRDLPMPDVPMPQFPQLGNADVVQVLKDLRNENKQLRADLNRLLGDVKNNTGNTASAVANSAREASRQRGEQLEEQRAATRAARLKGRTS